MNKTRNLIPALFAALALGLFLGLVSVRGMVAHLGSIWREWQDRFADVPRPTSILWLQKVGATSLSLEGSEGWLAALILVALFCVLLSLAGVLQPGFRLAKPPEENEGSGITTHLEVPLLLRAAMATVLSFWIAGALAPMSGLMAGPGRSFRQGALVLSGLPLWTSIIPGYAGLVVLSVLLMVGLWVLWGPIGPLARPGGAGARATFYSAIIAGLAAVPAVAALYQGRAWIEMAWRAYTASDREGWIELGWIAILVPVLAMAYLAVVAAVYTPARVSRGVIAKRWTAFAIAILTYPLVQFGHSAVDRLDVFMPSLAARLDLKASPHVRFGVLMAPDGSTPYTQVPDGSGEGRWDAIACNGKTIEAVEQYLQKTRYRTALAYRGYVHLHDCASLDWMSTTVLERNMAMLRNAPVPVAAQLLLEKLKGCPITPANKAYLDELADPAKFTWKDPQKGKQTLGGLYLRFGEMDRAREYLLDAGLNQGELRGLLGGLSRLTNGTITGKITMHGRAVPWVRIGVVDADPGTWSQMLTEPRAHSWRQVSAVAHTNDRGEFKLEHLAQGRYLLVVTGGDIGRLVGVALVKNHPGVIELDQFRPTQRLKPIDLQIRPLPRRQRPRWPSTTA